MLVKEANGHQWIKYNFCACSTTVSRPFFYRSQCIHKIDYKTNWQNSMSNKLYKTNLCQIYPELVPVSSLWMKALGWIMWLREVWRRERSNIASLVFLNIIKITKKYFDGLPLGTNWQCTNIQFNILKLWRSNRMLSHEICRRYQFWETAGKSVTWSAPFHIKIKAYNCNLTKLNSWDRLSRWFHCCWKATVTTFREHVSCSLN